MNETAIPGLDDGQPFNCSTGWGGAFRCWIDASSLNQVIFALACFLGIYAVLMWVYYRGALKEEDREDFLRATNYYAMISLVFVGNFLLDQIGLWRWLGLK